MIEKEFVRLPSTGLAVRIARNRIADLRKENVTGLFLDEEAEFFDVRCVADVKAREVREPVVQIMRLSIYDLRY